MATAIARARSQALPDLSRIARYGFLMALTLVFIAAIGMVETFDRRILIKPVLSLGYVAIGWVPLMFGYLAGKDEVLAGIAAPKKGARNVVAGLAAGAIGGFGLWAFAVLVNGTDWREIFPRLSPTLVDLLTFGRGLGFGFVALVGGAAVLAGLAGAGHLLTNRWRRAAVGALAWTFAAAVLEVIAVDMFDELRLTFVTDFLYDINGGLTVVGAIVVAVIAGFLTWRFSGGFSRSRARVQAMSPAERRRFGTTAFIVLIVLAVVLPMILGSLVNELLANVGLFLLMGLGLNVVVGYAGLLDLGYVAFFAVGAYTTAVLTSPIAPGFAPVLTLNFFSWEGWVIFGAVVLIAMLAGLVVGTPVIRMRGDYLAIVTLGFGEIVRLLFLSDWLKPTFGGAQGVRQVPSAEVAGLEITGINPQSIFYFVLVFVGIAIYVSWRLERSRVGRAWAALREDESVAEAMGIDTVRAKLLAFVTGAVLASFGGMIFAVKVGSVFPNSFALLVSIIVLVVVIVGGMGNIPGVIAGGLVLIGILGGPTQPGVLQEFQEFKLLIYGALLVFMMLQRPEGLIPSSRRSRELHQEEYLQDAWLQTGDPDIDPVGEVE